MLSRVFQPLKSLSLIDLIPWSDKTPCANTGKSGHKRRWKARFVLDENWLLCPHCLRELAKTIKITYDPEKFGYLKEAKLGLTPQRQKAS